MRHTLSNLVNCKDFSYQPMPFFDDDLETKRMDRANYSRKLDLNLYCIKRPQQTCFIRVTNPDMLAWGIDQGDMLVVEKQEALNDGDLVVLKQRQKMEIYELMASDKGEFVFFALSSKTPNIKTSSLAQLNIVGTITNTIHQIKPRAQKVMRLAA